MASVVRSRPSLCLHDGLDRNKEWKLGDSTPSTETSFRLYAAGDRNTSQRLAATGSGPVCADTATCRMTASIALRANRYLLLLAIGHSCGKVGRVEDRLIEKVSGVIGMDVIPDFMSVIRAETVLIVHFRACAERIEL